MSDTRDDFVVTFKPLTGYNSPSFTIRGESDAQLADRIASASATGIFLAIAEAHELFCASFNLNGMGAQPAQHPSTVQQQGGYQQPQQNNYPPQQQRQNNNNNRNNGGNNRPVPANPPPGTQPMMCQHGQMNFMQGQWGPFWSCTAHYQDQSRCKNVKA